MRNQAHTPPNSICDIGTQYQHFINVNILAISIHRTKSNGHIGQPASLCNSMVLVRARKCCVSLANTNYGQSFPVQWAEICWKSQQRYKPQIGRIPKRVADSLKCFAIQITILICDAFCHKIHDAGFNAIVDSKLTHLQSIEFCILHFAFWILHFGSFLFFAWDGFGGQTRRHSTWDGLGGQTRNSPGLGSGLTRIKTGRTRHTVIVQCCNPGMSFPGGRIETASVCTDPPTS